IEARPREVSASVSDSTSLKSPMFEHRSRLWAQQSLQSAVAGLCQSATPSSACLHERKTIVFRVTHNAMREVVDLASARRSRPVTLRAMGVNFKADQSSITKKDFMRSTEPRSGRMSCSHRSSECAKRLRANRFERNEIEPARPELEALKRRSSPRSHL